MNTDTVITALKGTTDALGQLIAAHAKLLRVELREDAQKLLRNLAILAIGVALAATGYILLMLGVAALLAPLIGWGPALLLLGAVHVLIGAVAGWRTVARFQSFKPLDDSKQATKRSVETLKEDVAPHSLPGSVLETTTGNYHG